MKTEKTDSSYQGWTNHETWCVQLWLTNEEPEYRHWTAHAAGTWGHAEADQYLTRAEVARCHLAVMLREEIENAVPLDNCGMYSDLLTSALSKVNWDEIANAWLEPIEEYEEAAQATETN